MPNPLPPLKPCRRCRGNIGDDVNGLCATCDPNHRWWKKEDKTVDECTALIEKMNLKDKK